MATIKDVAKVAGVSVATVSRVINNRGYLSDDVKQKVAQAMKKLDYLPNDLARSLHNQKSNIIGLIVPALSHPFFGEIAQLIETIAYDRGYRLLVCNSLRNQIKEREYIDMLKRSQVDGIIMGSHILEADDYMGLNLPVISLDRQLSPTIPYICSDNYVGGQIATEHLISKGCKKLLHISGSLEVKMLSNKRTDAFIDTCNKAGIEFLAYELPDSSIAHFHEENILMDILKKHSDCDGIFATSDVTAAALINAACQVGKKVPEDIQIVGFDGSLTALLTTPKITSIKQPMEDIARYAVDYLIKIMNGETVPTTNILPVKLLKQGSTN